jgi:hypothetical protein
MVQVESNKIKKTVIVIATVFTLVILAFGTFFIVTLFKEGKASQIPRFEVGTREGAEFCAECHEDIYDQWSKTSSHYISTTIESYQVWIDKLNSNYVLNAAFGEKMCISCMGPPKVGVDCETCHGLIPQGLSVEEAHEQKFVPDLEKMRKPEFCPTCHELPPSMTSYADWQKSEAAFNGITCQGCHMKQGEEEIAYHGFDSITRLHKADIYNDDLVIKDINYRFPEFGLTVENRIKGHAVPAVGPSRVLALEISFLDTEGKEKHKIVESFTKHMSLMPILGLFPVKIIENTQLQSGEARPLSYTLPSLLEGQINKAVITLRFYDIYDWFQQDITKAHWVSEPIIEKEVSL